MTRTLSAPDGFELLRSGHGRRWLWRTIRERLYSRREAVGMRRDLTAPFATPPTEVPLAVRQLRSDDDLSFITAVPGLTPHAAQERADQRWLFSTGLPACWVAVDPDGKVCFMTSIMGARDNTLIRDRWGGLFPVLQPDEVLLEGVYTAPDLRGLGVMPHVVARIVEEAAHGYGATVAIGFIDGGNIGSLKGAERAGFSPYQKRRESWLLFRRRIRFLPVDSPA